jgi:S1-C subfamily serine protease
MTYQPIPSHTEDSRHNVLLVDGAKPAREWIARITAFVFVVLLISGAAYLGFSEIQRNRRLDEEQGRRLAMLEEQGTLNNQQHGGFAAADREIRANLSLSTKLWADYNEGVCLISGSYVFVDPDTGRPLRTLKEPKAEENDTPGNVQRPLPTWEGEGELAQVDYEGTGFHVGDGYLLTNHHIAVEPWKYDPLAKLFGTIVNAKPRLTSLSAFFPGIRKSYPVKIIQYSSRDDIAVCKLTDADLSQEIPALPLSLDARSTLIGQPVLMMGYPMGIDRLLSILPMEEKEQLRQWYQDSSPLQLRYLARHDRIKPLITQGHVMDLYEDRIVYDAASGEGGSGAPVFGSTGRVIGIHYGYFQQNRVSNYAAPIARGIPLLKRAGWTHRN